MLGRQDLLSRLDDLGIETTTIDHPPLRTVEESQALRGDIPGIHTKNLFLKDKKGAIFLVTAREDADIDLKSLHKRLGCGRLSFGRAELLEEALGVKPGAVTPFAVVNDHEGRVRLVIEDALMQAPVLNAHPLENTATTTIAPLDLAAFARACSHDPLILDLTGPLPEG